MGTRNDWPLIFLIKPISEQIIWLARLSLAGRRHKESSLFIHWTLDTVTIAIHSLTVCVHNLRPFTRSRSSLGVTTFWYQTGFERWSILSGSPLFIHCTTSHLFYTQVPPVGPGGLNLLLWHNLQIFLSKKLTTEDEVVVLIKQS